MPIPNSRSESTVEDALPGHVINLQGVVLSEDDAELLEALKAGDESAFVSLVERHNSALLALVSMYVHDRLLAEEVIQETWIGLLESLDRFEGRSSLKTWIFRIAMNIARKRRAREMRTVPFSALDVGAFEPSVGPERFRNADDRWPGHWRAPPASWDSVPEERLLSSETLEHVGVAIESLPPAQKAVILLRDVEGLTTDEVCNVLGLTGTNARVHLHRARSKVRMTLERYLKTDA